MSKILDKATAFAKGKKVKCTITVLDAKNQSVENTTFFNHDFTSYTP